MSDGYTLMNSKTKFFTAPETSQPAPSNPVANVGTYNGDVTLRWKDNSNLETGYIIEVAEVGTNNFVPVGGVKANTTSFKLGKLNAGTEYVFRVKPSNSKQNYSTVSESFKIPTLCAATNSKICGKEEEPAYVINNVELSKGKTKLLSNPNSGCAGSATVNYFDTHQAKVKTGDKIDFVVQSRYSTNGLYFPTDVKIYCDWNNDGVFDEKTELLSSGVKQHTFKGSFDVPNNLRAGEYRLRVVMNYTGRVVNACAGNEMEDYALVIEDTTLSTIEGNVSSSEFAIFPNPVQFELNIKNSKDYVSFEIYDISGKLVKAGKLDGTSLNVSQLNSGLYIITAAHKMELNFLLNSSKNRILKG